MPARISLFLTLTALLLPNAIAQAQARIVSVEWLPLGVHSEILDAMEAALNAASPDASPMLERCSAFGDAAELGSVLAKLDSSRPTLAIGFGNRVSGELSARLPVVPLLAILDRQDAWNKEAANKRGAPALAYITEPDPSQVWEVATRLLPRLNSLAMLYTEGYKANVALAGALEADGARGDRRVVRLTIPPGNCRTDSDFEKALDKLRDAKPPALLYVPDDPNCSRFGNVICQLAAQREIATLGSEATIGKGCTAALALDTQTLGKECAVWIRRCGSATAGVEFRKAPYRIVFDAALHGVP